MKYSRSFTSPIVALSAAALLAVACGGGAPATTRPSGATSPPVSATPSPVASALPTTAPGSSLDPSLSDAGIVARVTITNDSRDPGARRNGTHDMIAVGADGSSCSPDLGDPTYTAAAWWDDAPNGKIHQFGVSVPTDDIPTEDGTTSDITDGAVSFDFVSETGFGTQYSGAAGRENQGSSTIAVTRSGDSLIFDFEGVTWDDVQFAGELICADG